VPVAVVESVNLARPRPNPYKEAKSTGIGKEPASGPVEVHDPGPRRTGSGSGVSGDFIGDTAHHGGTDQAVYAFSREQLDAWEQRLDRAVPNGFFGENLTTRGIDVDDARIGERWHIGSVQLQVTCPRIPCSTFRGWVGEAGWLKLFTEAARPGAYFAVVTPGSLEAGQPIEVVHRPAHEVTISLMFRALTTERELLPALAAAGDDLPDEIRRLLP
jgi:MOSC domain-containing protein YiiM